MVLSVEKPRVGLVTHVDPDTGNLLDYQVSLAATVGVCGLCRISD
jgi:hypothetical protein